MRSLLWIVDEILLCVKKQIVPKQVLGRRITGIALFLFYYKFH